jgi:MoaA/NifB/PqqE/SkfB family radical SAM enzyme
MYTDIKTGFTCNNSCVHCVIAPIRDDLQNKQKELDSSTDEVKRFIDEAVARGSDTVVLTGGEVTMRRDFSEILEYTSCKGLKIVIQTNGRMFASPAQREVLRNIPNIMVVIAIHGPDSDIHDRITRRKGSFSQTVRAIQGLMSIDNVNVCAKIVLSKVNVNRISDTVNLSIKLGVRKIAIAFPHAEDFPASVFREVVPRYYSIQDEINKILKSADENDIQVTFETIPYCIMPDNPGFWKRSLDASFSLYGKQNPGYMQRTGESCVHDWEKERKQIKYKGTECYQCVFDKVCEGVWEEYVRYFGQDEFIPINDPTIVEKL